jgi:hypothetical protein
MSDDDINDRINNNINLTTTNTTAFIQQHFISGDNTPVFAHVNEPICNIREVLVTTKHIPEALALIKTINIDLFRIMNRTAVSNTFENAEELVLTTHTTTAWKPYKIQQSIPATSTNTVPGQQNHQQRPKRAKFFNNERTSRYPM